MYQAQYYQAQNKCKSDIRETFLCIILCIKPPFWLTHTTREVHFQQSTIWEQPVAKFWKTLPLKKKKSGGGAVGTKVRVHPDSI